MKQLLPWSIDSLDK